MKNVILILGILTTVMVCGVVAGVSDNAAPEIDMDLNETQCRNCHDITSYLRNTNHYPQHYETDYTSCSDLNFNCHDSKGQKALDCMKLGCHNSDDGVYPVTDHHDFSLIFGDDDWDCLDCHEKGVPRPLDK